MQLNDQTHERIVQDAKKHGGSTWDFQGKKQVPFTPEGLAAVERSSYMAGATTEALSAQQLEEALEEIREHCKLYSEDSAGLVNFKNLIKKFTETT